MQNETTSKAKMINYPASENPNLRMPCRGYKSKGESEAAMPMTTLKAPSRGYKSSRPAEGARPRTIQKG